MRVLGSVLAKEFQASHTTPKGFDVYSSNFFKFKLISLVDFKDQYTALHAGIVLEQAYAVLEALNMITMSFYEKHPGPVTIVAHSMVFKRN